MPYDDKERPGKIPFLMGAINWEEWSIAMELRLGGSDKWHIVSPPEGATTRANAPTTAEIRQCMYESYTHCGTQMKAVIQDTRDPNIAWDKLKAACSLTGYRALYSAIQDLIQYSSHIKEGDKPIGDRITEITNLVTKIRSYTPAGKDTLETMTNIFILESIPDAYDHKQESLVTSQEVSIEHIRQILTSEEMH
jgi:hypothetical protein